MRIRDIMTDNPLTVDSEIPIVEAKRTTQEDNIRRLPPPGHVIVHSRTP